MLKQLWQTVLAYRKANPGATLEVRMHPATMQDCMHCEYNEVMSAFNLRTNKSPKTIFGYKLTIDESVEIGKYKVQAPRIN